MIEAFIRLNFVGVLVDNIKLISTELRTAHAAGKHCFAIKWLEPADKCLDVRYYFILRRQSRPPYSSLPNSPGAAHVLNAGPFSIRSRVSNLLHRS